MKEIYRRRGGFIQAGGDLYRPEGIYAGRRGLYRSEGLYTGRRGFIQAGGNYSRRGGTYPSPRDSLRSRVPITNSSVIFSCR